MHIGNTPQFSFNVTKKMVKWKYQDNDILFLNGTKDLPFVNDSLRIDRYALVICNTGKLQLEINMTTQIIQVNHILICHPNDIISNTMLSPDFDGLILCLSKEIALTLFDEGDLWRYFFHFSKHPIISISKESQKMLKIYEKAFYTKFRIGKTPFHKEIVCSIIRAVLYELWENISNYMPSEIRGVRHREILFKQFIDLLSGSMVKSRSVVWYAEQLGITPKHLSTVCKQVSGKTALEWINEYVAIDIRNILKNSDKSIKEVADLLRFPNVSFFSSYCRKHFGMPPMEYRKHLRNSINENEKLKHNGENNHK